ncbi:uncharacterized protein LOC131365124 isoform X2 [Hemibagrus wyckioides]|uniref:uncharacterized protein LOC131365124 isoform X2 n=1 Tax=Hemibagrus wyckioides TaxID=337641 RepID=UPI00266C15BB|nr:uncharacterized protein LOC131365124 isoform X2 [Hemibagrus wyckioides]
MAKLLLIQLTVSVFTLSLHVTLADIVSVHPGDNVTLLCNIRNYLDIFWYQIKSEELKLVLSAKRGKLDNHFSLSYSVNESHFEVNENSSLLIIGVKETDVGSYYCAAQNTSRIQFGKPITLKLTDKAKEEGDASYSYMDRCQILNIILTCVCSISFLTNIICICVFSSRVQGNKSALCHFYTPKRTC